MSAIPSQVDPQVVAPVFQGPVTTAGRQPAKRRITGREWRVFFLLGMVALVSLSDLYLTLTYLQNGGMAEGNPVARWVMSLGCPWMLAAWKGGLVGVTLIILIAFRKRASAEIAAWVCCLTMGWLVFQWSSYIGEIEREMRANPQLTQVSSWVSFDKN